MPSDLQQRLSDIEDLVVENRDKVGKRAGVPFIVYTYPPEKELEAVSEIEDFIEKLEFVDQTVAALDMREVVFSELEEERQILDSVIRIEKEDPDELQSGLKSSLVDGGGDLGPLAQRIADAANDPETDTVVVYRMGVLYPFASASTLMTQLEGDVPTGKPIVFCYPASVDDKTLRFLNESEGTYYRARVF